MEDRENARAAVVEGGLKVNRHISENNRAEVKQSLESFEEQAEVFKQSHLDYHALLKEEAEQMDSHRYFKDAEVEIQKIREDTARYLNIEKDEITSAKGSSTSSRYRAAAAARKAALLVEAKMLQNKQELEEQQMLLTQRTEKLRLETEIAKAEAEESVYAELDESREDVLEKVIVNQPAVPEIVTQPTVHTAPINSASTSEESSLVYQHQQLIDTIQAPSAEIISFSGDPLQYYMFMRCFDNNVHNTSLSQSGKLTRLIKYCTGRAHALIQCCVVMEPAVGYERARQLLKERYGNSYTISKAWMDKITDRPPVKNRATEALRDYADDLRNCKETVEAMGKDCVAELNTHSNLLKIVEKLPQYLQNRWRHHAWEAKKKGKRLGMENIVEFVEGAAEEANDPIYRSLNSQPDNHPRGRNAGSSFSTNSQAENRSAGETRQYVFPPCILCPNNHSLFYCDTFKKMTPKERLSLANEKKLCHNCLKAGHNTTDCRVNRTCTVNDCGEKHTKFLHQLPTNQASVATCELTGSISSRIALPIVPVQVKSADGRRTVNTYALLDSGSTNCFCTSTLLDELGIKGVKEQLSLTTLDRANLKIDTTLVSLQISSINGENQIELPMVYSKQSIPINNENIAKHEDIAKWKHLRDLHIPECDIKKIDLLIGQDVPEALLPHEVRSGDRGSPYATRTKLGWTLNGPLGMTTRRRVTTHFVQVDDNLEQQLERFWKLDSSDTLEDEATTISMNDKRAIRIWEESIVHEDGHYKLAIPCKTGTENIPNSRPMAEKRLESLKRRLQSNDVLKGKYDATMTDIIEKGYAKKVDKKEDQETDKTAKWYLPHHPVFNPQKPEKTRIVFDCAAKYQGVSLNDNVLQGPDLTNKLLGVLMRFREHPIALMADIEAMFHQVRVKDEDCDKLRFLWWQNGDMSANPSEYKMTVHLFGGTWSPSCCNFALKRTVTDFGEDYHDDTKNTVMRNFYVDDCLKSVKDVDSAKVLVEELTSLLKRGGFNLTKWMSNNREVLSSIPVDARAKEVKDLQLSQDDLPTERALGVYWQVNEDEFGFKIKNMEKPLTRRGLLSMISSIYDPLGFVSPVIVVAKMILQDLTFKKITWDEPLPENERERWQQWCVQLKEMEKFRIKRCVRPQNLEEITRAELHHFSDASQAAYGAVSYLRLTDCKGNIHCTLMMSKSHLAPLKQLTIPRLELQAATVSVKLDRALRRELDIQIDASIFWTDSTIVLQYIKNEHKRFHTFVANRVATIREASTPDQWRHIDTNQNPADYVSRGMTPQEIVRNECWTQGPSVLYQRTIEQKDIQLSKIAEDDPEVKATCRLTQQVHVDGDPLAKLFHHYSSWTKLKRAVAWILATKGVLLRKQTPPKQLTTEDLEEAESAIIKTVQERHYSEEMKLIKSKSLPRSHQLHPLQPIIKNDQLRLGTRLKNSPMPDEFNFPVILPRNDYIVLLLIKHVHESSGHSGREYVLATLRLKYWIIGARETTKLLLRRCVVCKRYDARPCDQVMADLPRERVTPAKPPFTDIGIDYFGPFLVKRGRSTEKRYGCIFTCLAIRAIHVEIAHSLDSTSFINCLQRFVSRRGMPKTIKSDNGTNFVGGERELRESVKEWKKSKIQDKMNDLGIAWSFNPPGASHMGGIWERQIRSVRRILIKMSHGKTFTDEGLSTLMCLVESIINNRPLTTVSSDPADLGPITPNHLLLMRSAETIPGKYDINDGYTRRRWRHIQHLADVFWERWLKEYIPTLQHRTKWSKEKRNIAVGDIVLIVDSNMPRNEWLLGTIEEAFTASDNKVRSVRVKTKNGSLVRSISKLCLLEANE